MAPQNKKPMSLEDLPTHLKSAREHGETGSAPVVNMGQIVTSSPNRSFAKWARGIGVAMLMVMALGVSVTTYNVMSPNQITVVVDVDDEASISQIVSDSGGQIIAVKQLDSSTYEVEVKTRKSKKSFLEWLLKDKKVKKAKLED